MSINQFLELGTTGSVVAWIQFSWAVFPLIWTCYLTNLSNSVSYVGVKMFAAFLDVLQGGLRVGEEYYSINLVG